MALAGPAAGRPCISAPAMEPCCTKLATRSMTCACKMEGTSKCSPAAAVPVSTKIPEPMIAPIPSAVSDHGPRVFLSRFSGFSESEISLSMDFLAKSCPARMRYPAFVEFESLVVSHQMPVHCHLTTASRGLMTRLAFGRSPHHLFHLALGRAAGRGALGFGSGLLARRPLCFLAFFFAQFLSIGHELSRRLFCNRI